MGSSAEYRAKAMEILLQAERASDDAIRRELLNIAMRGWSIVPSARETIWVAQAQKIAPQSRHCARGSSRSPRAMIPASRPGDGASIASALAMSRALDTELSSTGSRDRPARPDAP
jgi:hypothetical protein